MIVGKAIAEVIELEVSDIINLVKSFGMVFYASRADDAELIMALKMRHGITRCLSQKA